MAGYTLKLLLAPQQGGQLEFTIGSKTRSGFTSSTQTGLAAGTEITGAGASDWVIDAEGHIVPSGTYGAFKSFTRSLYALEAGGIPIVITVVPNRADFRFRSTDTTSSYQLKTLLELPGTSPGCIAKGDTLYGDGTQPGGGIANLRPPPAANGSWTDPATGDGVVTVRSLNVDTGQDEWGPTLRHGCVIRGINIANPTTGAGYIPLDLRQVWLEGRNPGGGYIIRYNNLATGSWGVSLADSKVSAAEGFWTDGITIHGGPNDPRPAFANGNRIDAMGKALIGGSTTAGGQFRGLVMRDNVFVNQLDDCMCVGQMGQVGNTATILPGVAEYLIEGNTGIGGGVAGGSHPDYFQDQGMRALSSPTTRIIGTIRKNVYVTNGASNGFQCTFLDDTVDPNRNLQAIFENLIFCTSAKHGVWMDGFIDPIVRFCTMINNLTPGSDGPRIVVPADPGGSGGLLNRNLGTDAPDITPQTGIVTQIYNTVLSASEAGIRAALPNWTDSGLRRRNDVLFVYTPSDDGLAMNPDDTVSGALFPAVPGQSIGAWNDGSIFQPMNADWVAAHPPAT